MLKQSLLALGALAQLQRTAAAPAAYPSAFDGQYLSPPAGPGNQAVEWWWFQALAPEVNGIIPSIEAIFYEGFAFSRAATDPAWRLDVSGVFPNGSDFFISTPLTKAPTVSTKGQAVHGDWAGVGSFSLAADYSSLSLTFDNAANGLTGSVTFKNLGTPAHGPCGDASAPPYFTSLAAGKNLSTAETALYEKTGWAITMPRAAAVVDVKVGDSHLFLDNAIGYHDHNWGPSGLDQFANTWLTGQGSCGPFDLTYLEVQALGSDRDADILKGFLAYEGKYLQNQCSLYGEHRSKDTIAIELTGQVTDAVTGQEVPTGMTLDYTLANGTHYFFTLHNSVEDPAQIPYHRWRLGGSGGQVGGPQYDCLLIGDWLNPGLATYAEGKSIFEEQ